MALIKNRQKKPVSPLAQSPVAFALPIRHSYLNGTPLLPTTTTRPMTNATIQLVINGNQVEGTMLELAQMLGIASDVMVQKVAPVVLNQEEKSVKFVEFFGATLESHIKGGKLFVSELNKLRHQGNDYRAMIRLYHDLVDAPTAGWAKRRQLLLTTSAIWRYTFKKHSSGLKYQIKAVTECDDCGEFAKSMVDRMIAEKLWVA